MTSAEWVDNNNATYADLYDYLYESNKGGFRDYVNGTQTSTGESIHESLKSDLSIKERFLAWISKTSDSQMNFFSEVGGVFKKVIVFVLLGAVFFCIIKFNLLKDIKAFLKELK